MTEVSGLFDTTDNLIHRDFIILTRYLRVQTFLTSPINQCIVNVFALLSHYAGIYLQFLIFKTKIRPIILYLGL